MHPRRFGRVLALAMLACSFSTGFALAAPDVHCHAIPLSPEHGADLGHRFEYTATVQGTDPHLTSHLLVLDRMGEILREIPIEIGTTFQFHLRDTVTIRQGNGPVDWLVYAPGVLFRAEVTDGFETAVAYASPYAAIRVDRPADTVFSSTTIDPSAPAHLIIGVAQMDPASIRIQLDCLDVMAAAHAGFPGGPFGGTLNVDGTTVSVQDLQSDFGRGVISLTLLDLPAGTHKLRVSGTPAYADDLPPGSAMWYRPLGALANERDIIVFRTEITEPADGAALPLGPVTVRGNVVHGLPIHSIRVYGADIPVPEAQFTPGDECHGDSYRVDFEATLPVADLQRDFTSGDDVLSAFDPAVNFVYALATDDEAHVSNDRARMMLGGVNSLAATFLDAGGEPVLSEQATDCEPLPGLGGYVQDGLAVSLSQNALTQSIRARELGNIRGKVNDALKAMEGVLLNSQVNPCHEPSDAKRAPDGGAGAVASSRTGDDHLDRTFRPMNAAPTFTPVASPDTVTVPDAFVTTLEATDPDGDALVFSLVSGPANIAITDIEPGKARFAFSPSCDQIGGHDITVAVTDGQDTVQQTFRVEALEADDLFAEITIKEVVFDPNTVNLDVALTGENEITVNVQTGPVTVKARAEDCYGDCGLLCCISWFVDVDVDMSNISMAIHLTPEQLLCGVDDPNEISPPSLDDVTIDGLSTHITNKGLNGLFAWLDPESIANQIAFHLGHLNVVLTGIVNAAGLPDKLHKTIRDQIVSQFPGFDFSGFREMQFDTNLPPSIPLTLDQQASDIPQVFVGSSLSMGLHSRFAATAPADPAPPWLERANDLPDVGTLGADLLLAASDDGLDQMFSALVSTGLLRSTYGGLTVGDVDPSLSIPALGITPTTPIVITLDPAQDPFGNAIAPIVGLMDDPSTPNVQEVMVRLQILARGILPRGGTVTDDRDVCSCLDSSPGCMGQPCAFYESVLKMNLLADLTLLDPSTAPAIGIQVTDVQLLDRGVGFDSYEALDFSAQQDQITQTAATSPLLAALRAQLNANMAPLPIPMEALSLGGFLTPTNLRLTTLTVNGSGPGLQDYLGLLADIGAAKVAPYVGPVTIGPPRDEPGNDPRVQDPIDARASAQPQGDLGLQAFPNPFNPRTVLRMSLPQAGPYRLTIYSLAGRRVRTFTGSAGAGVTEVAWDGTDEHGGTVAVGVYVARLDARGVAVSRKLALVK